jgi:hypothetical protein
MIRGDDFIIELWARIKPLVDQKDRLDAADAIVSVADEYGFAEGIEDHYEDLDRELRAAVKTRFGESEEDDEYEDEEW